MESNTKRATAPQPERETPSKALLFCPECGHRSRYDGDWNVVRSAHGSRYLCPDCRTEITSRLPRDISAPAAESLRWMWHTGARMHRALWT